MIVDWLLLGFRIAAPLLLYLFIGLIVYQIYQARRANSISGDVLRRLDDPGGTHSLAAANILGRDPDNDLILENDFISAQHASLTYRDGTWWLLDLQSKNGTYLNDIPIRSATPLAYGDIISLGDIQFRLERGQ